MRYDAFMYTMPWLLVVSPLTSLRSPDELNGRRVARPRARLLPAAQMVFDNFWVDGVNALREERPPEGLDGQGTLSVLSSGPVSAPTRVSIHATPVVGRIVLGWRVIIPKFPEQLF